MNESSPSNHELSEAALAYRADTDAADIEFPVEPGFDSRPPQLSPADYVEWCEEMLAALPPKQSRVGNDAETRCDVEFVL